MNSEFLTLNNYDAVITGDGPIPAGAYYDNILAEKVNILNEYIQLMSYNRDVYIGDVHPPMMINIQEYSRDMLNKSIEVTYDDIFSTINKIWVEGINKIIVSTRFDREDESAYFPDKFIFRRDWRDLTLYDIYTQSMLILSENTWEVESYRYSYTFEGNIPSLKIYTHS